jgi:hypothetical protein
VLITTNFSLTYFIVSSEVEGSKVPTWLGIVDTDGLSTLTAWAAGKFVPDRIAAFVNKSDIATKVKHRTVIIPGYVAQLSGELEEELAGWKVVVGPREASSCRRSSRRSSSDENSSQSAGKAGSEDHRGGPGAAVRAGGGRSSPSMPTRRQPRRGPRDRPRGARGSCPSRR